MCDKDTVTLRFDLGDEIYVREFVKPFKEFCPCPLCDPNQAKYDLFTRYLCSILFAENYQMMFKLYNFLLPQDIITKNIDYIYNSEYIQYYIKSLILHNKYLSREIEKLKTT